MMYIVKKNKPVNEYGLTISVIGLAAFGYNSETGECGFLIKCKNGTGAPTVKGSVVSSSSSADREFVLQDNEFDAVGVIAVDGIAHGEYCWLWRHGSLCQVLFEDGQDATRGYIAICSPVDGRAKAIAVPSSNPVVGEHFKEIGHVAEQKAAGTSVLALVHFHTL